jgi:hypothetical protein
MVKGFSSNCVDLEEACKVLTKSRSVQTLLKKEIGSKKKTMTLHKKFTTGESQAKR